MAASTRSATKAASARNTCCSTPAAAACRQIEPCAHGGIKNVYASKKKVGTKYPNGTVIVKSIAQPGQKGMPDQVAIMRKLAGRWKYVEYQLSGPRYSVIGQGQFCASCHAQAKANDYVFTKR